MSVLAHQAALMGAEGPTSGVAKSIHDALVSWWDFENNTYDAHGTVDLAVGTIQPNYTAGRLGQAISQSRRQGPTSADDVGSPMTEGGTFFGWVKLTTNTVSRGIFSMGQIGASAGEAIGVSHLQDLGFQGFVRNASNVVSQVTTGARKPLGVWYFVAVVNTGTSVQLWVDGYLVGQSPIAVRTDKPRNGFQIGVMYSNTDLPGAIDSVGYCKKPLSAEEMAWLYNEGAGRNYAQLVEAAG